MIEETELEKIYQDFVEKSKEIKLLKDKIEILKDTNNKLKELLGDIHYKTEGY